ncbi:hypothetical protein Tco_1160780 [Tanacetum coccineum]
MSEDNQKSPFGERGWDVKRILDEDEGGDGDASDENTKYFHGIHNKKRSQLAIRGTLFNGEWISDPDRVKNEFFSHFIKQFLPPKTPRFCFDFVFPNRLSSGQVEDLERIVTYDEVKRAVWDCGANKSPVQTGFHLNSSVKFER